MKNELFRSLNQVGWFVSDFKEYVKLESKYHNHNIYIYKDNLNVGFLNVKGLEIKLSFDEIDLISKLLNVIKEG